MVYTEGTLMMSKNTKLIEKANYTNMKTNLDIVNECDKYIAPFHLKFSIDYMQLPIL